MGKTRSTLFPLPPLRWSPPVPGRLGPLTRIFPALEVCDLWSVVYKIPCTPAYALWTLFPVHTSCYARVNREDGWWGFQRDSTHAGDRIVVDWVSTSWQRPRWSLRPQKNCYRACWRSGAKPACSETIFSSSPSRVRGCCHAADAKLDAILIPIESGDVGFFSFPLPGLCWPVARDWAAALYP